jgi:hypothetical protein
MDCLINIETRGLMSPALGDFSFVSKLHPLAPFQIHVTPFLGEDNFFFKRFQIAVRVESGVSQESSYGADPLFAIFVGVTGLDRS